MTLMKRVFVFMNLVFLGLSGTNDFDLKIVEQFDFGKDRTLVQYAADEKRLVHDIRSPYIIWKRSYDNPSLFSSISLILNCLGSVEEGPRVALLDFIELIEIFFLNESVSVLKEGIDNFFTSDECSSENFYWLGNVRRYFSLKRQLKKLKNLYSKEVGKETVKDYFQKIKNYSFVWKNVCSLGNRLEKRNSFTALCPEDKKNNEYSFVYSMNNQLNIMHISLMNNHNFMLNREVSWKTINATSENTDVACTLVKEAKNGNLTFIDVRDEISRVLVRDKPLWSCISDDVLQRNPNIVRWYEETKVTLQEVQSLSLKNDDKDKLVKLLDALNRLLFCYMEYDRYKHNWFKVRNQGLLARK